MSNERYVSWWTGKVLGACEYATENFKMYVPKNALSENEIKEFASGLAWECMFIDNGDYWTKEWLCAYFYKGEYEPIIIPILKPSTGVTFRKACVYAPPTKQANKVKNESKFKFKRKH